jgi:hypothetical protein
MGHYIASGHRMQRPCPFAPEERDDAGGPQRIPRALPCWYALQPGPVRRPNMALHRDQEAGGDIQGVLRFMVAAIRELPLVTVRNYNALTALGSRAECGTKAIHVLDRDDRSSLETCFGVILRRVRYRAEVHPEGGCGLRFRPRVQPVLQAGRGDAEGGLVLRGHHLVAAG